MTWTWRDGACGEGLLRRSSASTKNAQRMRLRCPGRTAEQGTRLAGIRVGLTRESRRHSPTPGKCSLSRWARTWYFSFTSTAKLPWLLVGLGQYQDFLCFGLHDTLMTGLVINLLLLENRKTGASK